MINWLASIVTGVVSKLIDQLFAWLKKQKQLGDKFKDIDKNTKKQADNLKKSKTEAEDEQAARDILNRDS